MKNLLIYNSIENDYISKKLVLNNTFECFDIAKIQELLSYQEINNFLKLLNIKAKKAEFILCRAMYSTNYSKLHFNPGFMNEKEKLIFTKLTNLLTLYENKLLGVPGINALCGDHRSKLELWGIVKKNITSKIKIFEYKLQANKNNLNSDWIETNPYNLFNWSESKTNLVSGDKFFVKMGRLNLIPLLGWFVKNKFIFEEHCLRGNDLNCFSMKLKNLISIDVGEIVFFKNEHDVYFGSIHQIVLSNKMPEELLNEIVY